jgi:protein-disulfide isomerase
MRTILTLLLLAAVPAQAQTIPWGELKDSGDLSTKEKQAAEKALRSITCYQGCKETIAKCLAARPRVKTAWRLANYVVFLAAMTLSVEEMSKVVAQRRESVLPAKIPTVAVDGWPRLGEAKPRVLIVEFADFECGHCASVSPMLEKLVKHFKGKVAVVFKTYPLAEKGSRVIAAQAALAAARQGKFWEMVRLLFEDNDTHTVAGAEKLARQLRLNVDSFRAAMKDGALLKQIERSKIEGVRLGVSGTPALFFNGKRYRLPLDEKHLFDRVEEELDLLAAGK